MADTLTAHPGGVLDPSLQRSFTLTDSVRRYIATQDAHHRKHSFVHELRELLNAAGIEFDEKYLL